MRRPGILYTLSVRNVRLHMLRSVLSALGIMIGVIAIVSMGMLGANMTMSVSKQLSSVGNTIIMTPYIEGGLVADGTTVSSGFSNVYFTESQVRDITQIGEKYGHVYAAYKKGGETFFSGHDDTRGQVSVWGLKSDDMQSILKVRDGTFPRNDNDVLIGPTLASRRDLQVGSRILIGADTRNQSKMRISGILESRGLSADLRSDSAIIAPDTWFSQHYDRKGNYDQVTLILDDIGNVQPAKAEINDKLNRRKTTINVVDSGSLLTTITTTVQSLTSFIMAIAAISLVVAAVSIFNVMMMSVTERIHEIGVLRSIGTRKDEIMRMFLYEAFVIGIIGSTLGAIISLAIGYFVVQGMIGTTEFFFTFPSLVYIPLGMATGIGICLISGGYPAWTAATLDPVEALRAK